MKKIILYLTLSLSFGCSNNDNSNNSTYNFIINKVYIDAPYKSSDCWSDIIITDGDFTETSTEYIQNDDIHNFISFNELVFPICEIESGLEFIWDTSNQEANNGMEGPNLFINIDIINHQLQSVDDLTDEITYARFKFTSENSFEYIIKLSNGEMIQNNYSGEIIQMTPYKDMGIYN